MRTALAGNGLFKFELEDPDAVPPEQVMSLSVKDNRMQLKADGKDQVMLLVRIPKDAGILDVSFATTAGSFIYSKDKAVKEYTDSLNGSYRYARTWLKTDTTTGPVYITAEVTQVRRRIMLSFQNKKSCSQTHD